MPNLNPADTPAELAVLNEKQRRVLWLSTNLVHHANHGRPNSDGAKVGRHQLSSTKASAITGAAYVIDGGLTAKVAVGLLER